MITNRLLIIFLITTNIHLAFCQVEDKFSILQPLKFEKVKNSIYEKDSLVILKEKIIFDKEVFRDSLAQDALRTHNISVFYYTNKNSKNPYNLYQWTAPVIVHFDKSIPKYLKENLITFIKNFENIPNLTISITKNIDDANYLIKSSDEEFNLDSYKFKSEEEKEKFAFNNGSYKMTKGGFSRIKSCVLKINTNHDKKTIQEKSLKQLFFLSLGRFFPIRIFKDKTSLISPIYENSDTLSKHDLLILKIHYNYIFHESINSTEYNKILSTYLSDL
ncbi:hypothetical protein [Winogradskyella ursingii]|uniref:hypothetical protein n=1 Tax=Winogradskyella ursingii TaxID=2686079 RepID=UPI0015CCFB87|nr:hypothetical protein [Winogradskyella ursingii]